MGNKNNLKIGAINWDAFAPGNTYFSNHALDSLGNEDYALRLPFYVEKNNGEYRIPYRTVKDYEKELLYAIDAGIDFFAYCWYPDTDGERNIWHDNEKYTFLNSYYPELNYARKMYQQSELNKKIGMCAIIFSINSYAQSDFNSLFGTMKKNYYVKVGNKPLLIIFDNYDAEFIELVKGYAAAENIEPYIAFINTGAHVDSNTDYTKADAVTSYGCGHSVETFSEHTAKVRSDNEKRIGCGISVIPMLSAGWNPMPRVDRPKPWVTYGNVPYAPMPTEHDIDEAFADLIDFTKNNAQADTGLAITFAWNEFEEGGYICPTLKEDGTTDDSLVKAFFKAKKKYIG